MMNVYKKEMVLHNRDVNMFRKLRTSRLFEILQEVCIEHTEILGAGRKHTLDQGLLWMVTLQHAEIVRMPEYDEKITIETWPGETMHVLFPRYCRILDENENVLLSSSAIWTLVDCKSRKIIAPDKYGIEIHGVTTGNEISQPLPPKKIEQDCHTQFEVPFSYVDLNGHMNNTRYFDLAEDLIPAAKDGCQLRSISTEYSMEICMGERIEVCWGEKDSQYYLTGEGDKQYFRMSLTYDRD